MSKFKVGDRVRTKSTCSNTELDKIYTVKYGFKDETNMHDLVIWDEDTEDGCSCQKDWTLVKPEFKVGDKVRAKDDCNNNMGGGEGIIEKITYKSSDNREPHIIIKMTKSSNSYVIGSVTTPAMWTDYIELISKTKLIENKMETSDIKKIDKSILAEANKEVLEEIANEQKIIAKAELRVLYEKKNTLEAQVTTANDELKTVLKDLKSITPKA